MADPDHHSGERCLRQQLLTRNSSLGYKKNRVTFLPDRDQYLLLAFRDGQLVDRLVGIGSLGELRRALTKLAGTGPQVDQRVRV
jgi:hypothetical protein